MVPSKIFRTLVICLAVLIGSRRLTNSMPVEEKERNNLSESIQLALDLNPTVPVPESETERPDATTVATSKPSNEESTTMEPVKITIQQLELPEGENIFTGLAQNVGTLNIGGIIMEAFKLAQVSIGLFGQSFTNQLLVGGTGAGTPVFVITNTTKLVGVN